MDFHDLHTAPRKIGKIELILFISLNVDLLLIILIIFIIFILFILLITFILLVIFILLILFLVLLFLYIYPCISLSSKGQSSFVLLLRGLEISQELNKDTI